MKNVYTENLQLGRENIGREIKILENKKIRRTEEFTKIKDVIICPWSNDGRRIWLDYFDLDEDYQAASRKTLTYFKDNEQNLNLRVTYITESKSKFYFSYLNSMLDLNDFEFVN